MERTGGCAKLNKLTEIGRSGACNTFIAKSVCFVLFFFLVELEASGEFETEEWCGQFYMCFSLQDENVKTASVQNVSEK